jgi:hypothetical protein
MKPFTAKITPQNYFQTCYSPDARRITMEEFLQCLLVIGIVVIGLPILWALLANTAEMHNWTEEDWIENYEGDVDDPMWH